MGGYIGAEPVTPVASYVEDKFTGDGTATVFVLSETISSDAEATVIINGLVQDTSEYAISGSSLSFTTPPVDQADIAVRYSRREQSLAVPDNSIGVDQLGGMSPVLQQQYTDTTAVVTCSTTIPADDTIPQQSTEGTLVLSQAITPKNVNSLLLVEFQCYVGVPTSGAIPSVALFQDSTEDALRASISHEGQDAASQGHVLVLRHRITAGSTSETTFKIHVGATSGNAFVNATSLGVRLFGGVSAANLTITEYSESL